jgi:hypothetical protein
LLAIREVGRCLRVDASGEFEAPLVPVDPDVYRGVSLDSAVPVSVDVAGLRSLNLHHVGPEVTEQRMHSGALIPFSSVRTETSLSANAVSPPGTGNT